MSMRCAMIVVLFLTACAARAETYYVATDGKTDFSGSKEKPWPSVESALSKVGGGHTIIVKPGIYRGPMQIAKQYAGTKERPTVIQSEVKWQAVIIGAEYHVISNDDGCDWLVIDGFEVMGGRYDGVKMNGDYNIVRNCWVHNNKAMGIAMHNQKGGVIENNLIEFNGGHIQFDHGVYADGDELTVSGNIVRHNASYGLHLYPSIKNSRIVNNLVYGQVRRRGIIVACPQGGGKNVIVNNTVVENAPLTIWNGNGEVIVNNILVADGGETFSFDDNTQNVQTDYNFCVPKSEHQGPHSMTGDPSFIDQTKGVFWLREGSPAIGKGSSQYAPTIDFWGRPRPQGKAPDLGAFAFEPLLTQEQVRAGWDHGWAYHRHGNKVGLPDLWVLPVWPIQAETYTENFDQEPANWEGINNRSTHFAPKTVTQNFGYSASTHHAGGQPGEIGGKINPAGEAAYYGYRLPDPLTLDAPSSASGKILVERGPGHFLLGFFNADTLNEWRTPNTLVARINSRGDGFHCHVEYCTSRWRCEAGVIGAIVRGQRIEAAEIPGGQVYEWQLAYDPKGAEGSGLLTFTLDGKTATCPILKEHRADGATFTYFGLLPIPKTWDGAGEVWIDEVTINGRRFDFSEDPKWNERDNRRTYETNDTRPRFDFGWSRTHWAGGKAAGELGGLIFRGDCRDPRRLAAYGARLSTLTLNTPLYARGKVSMIRGVTDSTASIGFYHSTWSLHSSLAQDQSIPMDYIGINIEGPSSEGFFFYPVYRVHGRVAGSLGGRSGKAPRIYPDRKVHDWLLEYNPAGAGGRGQITVGLDGQTCTLDLEPGAKAIGALFNRFGICTPWIDGNSVTVFFDDIEYTCVGETVSKDSCKAEM